MPLPRIVPALADLTQDIAGPVPVDLLHDWAAGTRGADEAARLLGAYRVEGTVVATDSSGLTRMTEERDLLDVLALVSEPKEVIHALGTAIGGRPVGLWVADNTEMYYVRDIEPGLVVAAMSEAQARLESRASVGVGMCVHCGEFYEVGGGLYGDDAEAVERLAEDFAGPGDVLLTRAVVDRLGGPAGSRFAARPELEPVHPPGVYVEPSRRRLPDLRAGDRAYPHPYPEEFFALLADLRQAPDADRVREQIYEAYLRDRVVVFVSHAHPARANGLPALLDDLVSNALLETIIRVAMRAGDHVSGLGGGLAVLTFDATSEALEFAQAVRERFGENGVAVKMAIDQGPVLFFRNPRGPSGIAGDPVNVASKLSEDCGTAGRIRISTRACGQIAIPPDARPFEVSLSGVTLSGVEL